ncbi:MAG: hypothetical protein EAZ97_09025 [Bacteroidetes bacterium]|nr:MAG: hypothetical protein EAZ97_09025 [Bacteroidota bacterium]
MKNYLNYISFLLVFLWSMQCSFAQEPVRGTVIDEQGDQKKSAKVSIDGSEFFQTNKMGIFQMILPNSSPKKAEVLIGGKNILVKKLDYNKENNSITITIVSDPALHLKGKVVDSKGNKVANAKVILDGFNQVKPTVTNSNGLFSMELPSSVKKQNIKGFIVLGTLIQGNDVEIQEDESGLSVNIRLDKESETLNTNNNQQNKNEGVLEVKKKELGTDTKQVVHVVMFDENSQPVKEVEVIVQDDSYITDQQGRFEVKWAVSKVDSLGVISFTVVGFEIVKKFFDARNDLMYLYVHDPLAAMEAVENTTASKENKALDTAMANYAVYFHRIVNQLELRKQMLIEKSTHIREDIEDISIQLQKEKLSPSQRKRLMDHLKSLEGKLVETDMAFEQVEQQTHTVIDKMENVINEKDEQINQISRDLKQDIIIFVSVSIVLLVIALGSYWFAARIKRQNKELEAQKEQIQQQKNELEQQKNKLEIAYKDIQELSSIGQEITAAIDFSTLIKIVNKHIESLLGATSFGVGVINEKEQSLEYIEYIRNQQTMSRSVPLNSADSRLSAWCAKNQKDIYINDLDNEWKNYLTVKDYDLTGKPKSLIYLPLMIENRCIGVVTVQSSQKNAFDDLHIQMLKTLESYIAIALFNANVYEEMRSKNKKITDSIRYAQTIQEAILPTKNAMQESLKEFFVIYKAKDIVSGDFYWFSSIKDNGNTKNFVAAIDCTGHGVPGAFMSMIGNNLLIEIINQQKVYDTASILNKLSIGVKVILKQDEKDNDDGMDVCLCLIEPQNVEQSRITFTGAKRPLYFIRHKTQKLQRLRGDLKSVGGWQNQNFAFTKQEVLLERGDMLYLTSDGLISQQSKTNEKYGTERFENLLQANFTLPVEMQKEIMERSIELHQEGVEQRDDLTILGIRI